MRADLVIIRLSVAYGMLVSVTWDGPKVGNPILLNKLKPPV